MQAQAALHLVARGVGDTVISRAIAHRGIHTEHLPVHATSSDPPLYNTFAVVRRRGVQLSPATEELRRLALDLLVRNATLEHRRPPGTTGRRRPEDRTCGARR
ncbi:MAG TPA: hypothetical protein VER97_04670 [Geodermatophilus sp.]|nr:hypothetical protein [Geodermatophilus sp.]